MEACEFLFPHDLSVTPSNVRKVLVIGSCLSEAFVYKFRSYAPETEFTYIAFNNASELPAIDLDELKTFDFQILQMPLRFIVTDQCVRFGDFDDTNLNEIIIQNSIDLCNLMLEAGLKYNTTCGLLSFVSNFFVPQISVSSSLDRINTIFDLSYLVRKLNAHISNYISKIPNVYNLDVDSIGNSMGKRYFLDDSFVFYFHGAYWDVNHLHFDYSPSHNAPKTARIEELPPLNEVYAVQDEEMFRAVWLQCDHLFRVTRQIDMVKLVVFDLDDTLWRGQIAEDYGDDSLRPVFHGWPLGIWEAIHHLRARGIMVAICSKNDEDLVRSRWDRAIMQSWVRFDDFLFTRINWKPKSENILEIISAAKLTPKSVVFVDDNPVERESVRQTIPGIRVIGSNPYVTKRILLWSSETKIATLSAETVSRETMMRQEQVREQKRQGLSRAEFLAALKCDVTISKLHGHSDPSFNRCLELLNKTNQFNTTGVRHSATDIVAFLHEGGEVFAFHVADRFSHYGLVGVILYRVDTFVQFAMSCRVLGLDIETSVLNFIMRSKLAETNLATFQGLVHETTENMVCRDVYSKVGFVDLNQGTRFEHTGPIGGFADHLTILGA